MRHKWVSRKAFTLIELMVVVTIIAILAALIVPALQRAQARAMTSNCMAKTKAIAGSIHTYAAGWDGWTNPDSEYYVALMGYKIDIPASLGTGLDTTGYFGEPPGWASASSTASYKYAQSEIKTFRCPVDESPQTSKHAVKTSYKVGGQFAGRCIAALTDEANRVLMVREVGKRHPVGQSGTEGHFVYADLHSSLGYVGPVLPGGWLRIWYGQKVHNLNVAANSVTWGQAPYEDDFYSGNWYFGIYDVRNWCWGRLGTSAQNDWWGTDSNHTTWTWHEGRQRYPQNWAMRLDGLFRPPASGTWQFQVQGTAHGWCYFGIGRGVSSAAQGFDTAPSQFIPYRIDWWINSGWFSRTDCSATYANMDSNLYYPIAHYNSWCCWSGGHYVQARRLDAAGNPDPVYNQINLNSTNVFRIP